MAKEIVIRIGKPKLLFTLVAIIIILLIAVFFLYSQIPKEKEETEGQEEETELEPELEEVAEEPTTEPEEEAEEPEIEEFEPIPSVSFGEWCDASDLQDWESQVKITFFDIAFAERALDHSLYSEIKPLENSNIVVFLSLKTPEGHETRKLRAGIRLMKDSTLLDSEQTSFSTSGNSEEKFYFNWDTQVKEAGKDTNLEIKVTYELDGEQFTLCKQRSITVSDSKPESVLTLLNRTNLYYDATTDYTFNSTIAGIATLYPSHGAEVYLYSIEKPGAAFLTHILKKNCGADSCFVKAKLYDTGKMSAIDIRSYLCKTDYDVYLLYRLSSGTIVYNYFEKPDMDEFMGDTCPR